MTVLSLILAPNPILKKISQPVTVFDAALKSHVQDLCDTMEYEQAVGMASIMVGVDKRVIVVDMQEGGLPSPRVFINPEIIIRSDDMQTHDEASICYIGISAEVSRAREITLHYKTVEGNEETEVFEGFISSVIQHEMDYLEGRSYLDHLSKLKRDTLLRKMQKIMKRYAPHVHGEDCNH